MIQLKKMFFFCLKRVEKLFFFLVNKALLKAFAFSFCVFISADLQAQMNEETMQKDSIDVSNQVTTIKQLENYFAKN